jgi:hypothetical protein
MINPDKKKLKEELLRLDGVIVSQEWGSRGAEGEIRAIKYELDRSSKISVRKYSNKFMEYHANIYDEEDPAVKGAKIVEELISNC